MPPQILSEMSFILFWSGWRESNPLYIDPIDAYYRYTTARWIEYIEKSRGCLLFRGVFWRRFCC